MLHAHDPNSPIKPKYLASEAAAATPALSVLAAPQIPYPNHNISFGHLAHQPQLHQSNNNNNHVPLSQSEIHQHYHLQQPVQQRQNQQPLFQQQQSNHSTHGNSTQNQTASHSHPFVLTPVTGPNSTLVHPYRHQLPLHSQQHGQLSPAAATNTRSESFENNGNDLGNISGISNTTQNKPKTDINTHQQQQRGQSQVPAETLNHPPPPTENSNEEQYERFSSQQSASFMSHHDAVCNYLYQTGFLGGLFSDVTVHVPNLLGGKAYNLHSVILARSPLFFRLLAEPSTRGEVTLSFADQNINEDGLAIAIGHLYAGYSQHLVHSENATAVLAAAHLLQLDDLASIAAEKIKSDINRETILWYVKFVNQESGQPGYGRYTAEIRDVCFNYITKSLPRETNDNEHIEIPKGSSRHASVPSSPNGEPRPNDDITSIFVQLPFHWLKLAIESSQFCIPSDMKRYQFAQNVISLREKVRSMRVAKGELEGGGEESVVLSFGRAGSNGRTVTIVRKPIKGSKMTGKPERVLWKVPM